jgi:diaminopimelate epimerase
MKIKFIKTEGAGNDFILVDMIGKKETGVKWPEFAKKTCARKLGIGADGVLVLENSPNADFKMRIFNPDGSEAEMCGNGARCCTSYYFKKKSVDNTKFETMAGMLKAEKARENNVRLLMTSPVDTKLDMIINTGHGEMSVSFSNTGVPHAVVETEHLDNVDVEMLGRAIRYNENFMPQGTNVDFVSVTGKSSISVRTYERGVEQETLACGTGVVASAIISGLKGRVSSPVTVLTKGQDKMKVYFKISQHDDLISRINDVKLEGKVNEIYEGSIELDLDK